MALQLEAARSKSILDVAQALGMTLDKAGRTYHWQEHDSLVFFPDKNRFHWYSRDISGDAITLVQTLREVSFKEAVAFIESGNFEAYQPIERPREPFRYTLALYEVPEAAAAYDYLTQARGLSAETVDTFKNQGLLAQATLKTGDVYEPVVVFKSLSFDGSLIGTSLQGIRENKDLYARGRLKKIGYGSDGQAGLSFKIGHPQRLVFCEAPIDLLSYYESHKESLKDVQLVAMDGLKEATVSRYAADLLSEGQFSQEKKPSEAARFLRTMATTTDYFKDHPDFITLAVDNDEAGRHFLEKLQNEKIPVLGDLPALPEGERKMDWNDALKREKIDDRVQKKERPSLMGQSRLVLPVSSFNPIISKEAQMSSYKLVTLDPRFIAETVARTGSEELLYKAHVAL